MKFTSSQTSFRAGRLSPKLNNRIDTEQYKDGGSIVEAMKLMPEGGAERTKGYRYINADIDRDLTRVKQISFTDQGNEITLFITTADFSGDYDVTITKLIAPYYYGTEETVTLFSDPGIEYLPEGFEWAQVNNGIVLVHASGLMAPQYIFFDADGDFKSPVSVPLFPNVFSPFQDHFCHPMSDIGANSATLTISWDGTHVSVTCPGNAEVIAILQSPGRILYMEGRGSKDFGLGYSESAIASNMYLYYAGITNGAKFVPLSIYTGPADIFNVMGVTSITQWAYSLFETNNWPRTVCTYEGRVIFGSTPKHPLSIFGSKVNTMYYFNQLRMTDTLNPGLTPTAPFGDTLVTDPYIFTLSAKSDSKLTFLEAAQSLIIGSDRRESVAGGGEQPLSPLSVNIKPYTAKGSIPNGSVSNGAAVYFISAGGKKLHKFKYNQANGSYVSQEVSLLFADLIEQDRIKSLCWATHLGSIMILMESGKLYAILDSEETAAFWDTKMEGVLSIDSVLGDPDNVNSIGDHLLMYVEGIGVCTFEQTYFPFNQAWHSAPSTDIAANNAFMYLDRATTIVRMEPGKFSWNDEEIIPEYGEVAGDFYPIDVEVYPPGTILTVLDMAAEEDTIEFEVPEPEIGDQYVPLDYPADYITIGITPRTAKLATMPLEAGQQWGSAQMGIKNIDALGIRYYRTYSYEISADNTAWQEVVVTDSEGNLTTGRHDTKFSSSPRHDQIVYLRNTKAEPLTVLGINMKGLSNDG